jgi:glycosyltransferase involved in cell wall biosynthesis
MTSRKPRIVVDALSAGSGGGKRYIKNLFGRLPEQPLADVYAIAAPHQKCLFTDGPFTLIECTWANRSPFHRTWWLRHGLPRLLADLQATVYYAPGGTLPTRLPSGCKSAVAFRNQLPFTPSLRRLYPLGLMRLRTWLLRHLQAGSFSRGDLVIFVSQHGRELIDREVPDRRGRSVVIPHGVEEAFLTDSPPQPRSARWPEGYLLYVSTLDFYKAQIEVVEAWARVRSQRRTPEKLVLAGPEFAPYGRRLRRRIAELGLRNEVVLLGPVPADQLPALHREAKVNIFASRCENCPNTLLEALASGRPVVCSKEPPMPEFGADAVEYFDPLNPSEFADLLVDLLGDQEWMERLGKKGIQRARNFPLDECVKKTWESLFELAGASRSGRASDAADPGGPGRDL